MDLDEVNKHFMKTYDSDIHSSLNFKKDYAKDVKIRMSSFLPSIDSNKVKSNEPIKDNLAVNFDPNDTSKYKDFKDNYMDSEYEIISRGAYDIGIPANALAGVIWNESSGKTDAKNPDSTASGLIQFTEATAKGLGTTTEAIRNMTFEEQMPYIKKYFAQYKSLLPKVKTPLDLHALIFYPQMMYEGDDFILGSRIGKEEIRRIAEGNKALDTNKDGQLTKSEFYQWAGKRY